MEDSEWTNFVPRQDDHAMTPIEWIRALNDRFRKTFSGGRVVITDGIVALGPLAAINILQDVRGFSTFTDDNDPHGEHDFGAVEHNGNPVFWKIDYYDTAYEAGSPDPANPAVTGRLLTVMLAEEY